MRYLCLILCLLLMCGFTVEKYDGDSYLGTYEVESLDEIPEGHKRELTLYIDGVLQAKFDADDFITWLMQNVMTAELIPHQASILDAVNKNTPRAWYNLQLYATTVGLTETYNVIFTEAQARGANVA